MSIHTQNTPSPDSSESKPSDSTGGASRSDFRLKILDQLITSGKPILYEAGDFKDDQVVGKFVKDHRPLRTAMLGTMIFAYADPCTCCIPAYGSRDCGREFADSHAVIGYIQEAKTRGEALDLVFVSEELYNEILTRIKEISPETKLIVACDMFSASNASELRNRGIPATDDDDYMNCAPLNAVIALIVFDELMTGEL